ncbi:MAG TPA: hypothetical protein VGJ93_01230 [Desulfuromonadaceae bacterium]
MFGFYFHKIFRWIISAQMSATLTLVLLSACGEDSSTLNQLSVGKTTVAKGSEVASLPRHGKPRLNSAPAKALFGMIYTNMSNNREYIFDGAEWVPHDQSVDNYYNTKSPLKAVALIAEEVCSEGDPACTPTGAHGGPATQPAGHYSFDCKVCHKIGGRLVFDKYGPAYAAGKAAPSFDANTKTCSNIACHGVPAGTFSYYFPGGDGEPVLNTVNYGGTVAGPTPSWYSIGASGCKACHGDPPLNGSNGSNAWHSGYHGGGGPSSPQNQCQFCHPDASSPNNGIGDIITNPLLHANGTVNVQATFKSSCFSCH